VLESDSYRGDRPLEFLQMSHIEMKQQKYIRFRGQHQTNFVDDDERDRGSLLITKHYLTPTELIKFISENVMEEVSEILDKIFIKEEGELDELDIPSVIETKGGFFEEISDLNGIAIPCIYYDYLKKSSPGNNSLLEIIRENIAMMRSNEHMYLKEIVNALPENLETTADYLYLANISVAVQETLYFKLKQIDRDEYSWLNDGILDECKARLDKVIDNTGSLLIEETIIYSGDDKAHRRIDELLTPVFDANTQFRFTARIDLMSDSTIWELKCTSKISLDHMLQVVIYAWLWKMHADELPEKKFQIFNVRTRELLSLNATQEDLNTIIVALLKGKYKKQEVKSDEEFISSCFCG
jgi:hypothetical protein